MKRFEFARRAPGRPAIATFWWDICQSLSALFVKVGFGLRVTGGERIPSNGPLLYLSNHQGHHYPYFPISDPGLACGFCRP